MSAKIAALVTLLMSLPQYSGDIKTETEPQRRERMTLVAGGIDWATQVVTCSGPVGLSLKDCKKVWYGPEDKLHAALVAQGWYESNYGRNVHMGRCLPHQCDPRRTRDKSGKVVIYHKARGPWQVHASTPVARLVWSRITGPNLRTSTRAGAWAAAYSLSINACGGDVTKMFGAQAGRGCRTTNIAIKKASKYHELMARYRQIKSEQRSQSSR